MLATPFGFCVASSWPMLLPTAGFSCMEFLQLAFGKNIAGAGRSTLVSAAYELSLAVLCG